MIDLTPYEAEQALIALSGIVGLTMGLLATWIISDREYSWHVKFKKELFDKLEKLK